LRIAHTSTIVPMTGSSSRAVSLLPSAQPSMSAQSNRLPRALVASQRHKW
jgi:hypothetical protein